MARFYLHVFNGSGETRDEEGIELPSLDSARARAFAGIRSILREELSMGLIDFGGMVRITDEDGRTLAEIPFATAVEVRNGGNIS